MSKEKPASELRALFAKVDRASKEATAATEAIYRLLDTIYREHGSGPFRVGPRLVLIRKRSGRPYMVELGGEARQVSAARKKGRVTKQPLTARAK